MGAELNQVDTNKFYEALKFCYRESDKKYVNFYNSLEYRNRYLKIFAIQFRTAVSKHWITTAYRRHQAPDHSKVSS